VQASIRGLRVVGFGDEFARSPAWRYVGTTMQITRQQTARQARGLLRVFGVAFGIAVIIGNTIGAGILRTPGQIAEYLPSSALFLGVWVLGGLYAVLGANALSELAVMMPRSGGQTVFVRRALGPFPGFVVGWSDWVSTAGSCALIALVIGEYVGALLPVAAAYETAIAVLVTLWFAGIQSLGARTAGSTQVLTSALKALALIILVAACFLTPAATSSTGTVTSTLPFALAVVLALQAVIYTYDGWTGVIYFSEEVEDPERAIPRAMMGGVLAVTAVYLLVNLAFLHVLPIDGMAGDELVAASAGQVVFGDSGGTLIRLLTVISMLSAVNALILMAPRVLYAIGTAGLLQGTTRVDSGGTPVVAHWISTTVALLFIITGTVPIVIAVTAFFFVANYTLSYISLFVLRAREPEHPRQYRAWGHPWTTGLVLVGSLAFLAASVLADTRNSLYSIGLLALSVPVYLFLKQRARRRVHKEL